MFWLVVHRSAGNLVAGPFNSMEDATNFSISLEPEFAHDAVSVCNSLEEAVQERSKEFTFVPVKE